MTSSFMGMGVSSALTRSTSIQFYLYSAFYNTIAPPVSTLVRKNCLLAERNLEEEQPPKMFSCSSHQDKTLQLLEGLLTERSTFSAVTHTKLQLCSRKMAPEPLLLV